MKITISTRMDETVLRYQGRKADSGREHALRFEVDSDFHGDVWMVYLQLYGVDNGYYAAQEVGDTFAEALENAVRYVANFKQEVRT
jgi:hypothetical protein